MALAVAEGLHFAHTNGVLHRDVEPANILFTADGVPKVGDFGIARRFEGSGVTASQIIGTSAYMAPEQYYDEKDRLEGIEIAVHPVHVWPTRGILAPTPRLSCANVLAPHGLTE